MGALVIFNITLSQNNISSRTRFIKPSMSHHGDIQSSYKLVIANILTLKAHVTIQHYYDIICVYTIIKTYDNCNVMFNILG